MKKINLNDVENKMLNEISNDEIIDNKNSNYQASVLESILIILIISLFFLLIGFFIGQTRSNDLMYSIANKDIQRIIEEYNYILDNYYGDIDNDKLVTGAIEGMLSTLDDYSGFLGKDTDNLNIHLKGEYVGLGIGVLKDKDNQMVITTVYDNSPAAIAGLKTKDIIVKINDENIGNIESGQLLNKINNLENINLEVSRDSELIKFSLKKGTIQLKSVSYEILNDNIGYIKVDIFAENTDEQFTNALLELQKNKINNLIIDLRNNSGGHLTTVENMISQFLSDKHVIFQTEDKSGIEKIYSNGKEDKNFKIVILQNGFSASASEVMASSLKENLDAYIIGEKSFGKGTVQGVQSVGGLGKYKMTTKKWLTSKGDWINKKGITPDKEIILNKEYYSNPTKENDNQLKEAINYFSNQES